MLKTFPSQSFPQMKRAAQITNTYCGPAVVEMLLSFLGVEVTQEQIIHATRAQSKIEEYGMTPQELMQAVQIVAPRYSFWYKERATLDELNYLVNKVQYPVGIEWQGVFLEYADDDDGHYSVITGLDLGQNMITVADPFEAFAGNDRTFDISTFTDRWWDVNEIINPATNQVFRQADNQVMFVVTPRLEMFPLQLGMISNPQDFY